MYFNTKVLHNSLLRFSLAEKMNENYTILLHSESNEKIQTYKPNQLKDRNNGQGNPLPLLHVKFSMMFDFARIKYFTSIFITYLSDVSNFIFLEEESFVPKAVQERSAMVGSSSSSSSDTLSKAVSANITRILEDLLKNYDKTERPSYQDGEISKQS